MAGYLTTRQVQDILQVDRTTIYRMVDRGSIPAVKVGNQWRFPRAEVETWLHMKSSSVIGSSEVRHSHESNEVVRLLPRECVQQIQDAFADALGVMILTTDMDGNPLTRPSNACGLYELATRVPDANRHCMEAWAAMARNPSMQPIFVETPLGLKCARGLVRVGSELSAMVVLGCIAPKDWPPTLERLQDISVYLGVDPSLLEAQIEQVFYLDDNEQRRLLPFVQRIADVIAHIITERKQLFDKLESISELSRI
ncbi:MAG: PocR ligand-binding domain-containing protein [Caldilineaceae bacterium]